MKTHMVDWRFSHNATVRCCALPFCSQQTCHQHEYGVSQMLKYFTCFLMNDTVSTGPYAGITWWKLLDEFHAERGSSECEGQPWLDTPAGARLASTGMLSAWQPCRSSLFWRRRCIRHSGAECGLRPGASTLVRHTPAHQWLAVVANPTSPAARAAYKGRCLPQRTLLVAQQGVGAVENSSQLGYAGWNNACRALLHQRGHRTDLWLLWYRVALGVKRLLPLQLSKQACKFNARPAAKQQLKRGSLFCDSRLDMPLSWRATRLCQRMAHGACIDGSTTHGCKATMVSCEHALMRMCITSLPAGLYCLRPLTRQAQLAPFTRGTFALQPPGACKSPGREIAEA